MARIAAALLGVAAITGVAALAGESSRERLAQWAPDIATEDPAEQPAATTGDERAHTPRGVRRRDGERRPEPAAGPARAAAPNAGSTGDPAEPEGGEPSGLRQVAGAPTPPRTGGTAPPRARVQPDSGRTGEGVRSRPSPAPGVDEPTEPVAPEPAPAPVEPAPAPKPEKPPKTGGPPAEPPGQGGRGDDEEPPE